MRVATCEDGAEDSGEVERIEWGDEGGGDYRAGAGKVVLGFCEFATKNVSAIFSFCNLIPFWRLEAFEDM